MADFLIDNFNGSGLLSAHTPDVGAGWRAGNGTAYDMVDFNQATVSGGKALYFDNTGTGQAGGMYAISGVTPPSADYYVEGVFTILGGLAHSYYTDVFLRAIQGGVDFPYWSKQYSLEVQVNDPPTGNMKVTLFGYQSYGFPGFISLGSTTMIFGDQTSIKMRLEAEGTNIRAFINDVKIFDVVNAAVTAAGSCGFYLVPYTESANCNITSFKAGPLGVVVPPAFWTEFAATSEIDPPQSLIRDASSLIVPSRAPLRPSRPVPLSPNLRAPGHPARLLAPTPLVIPQRLPPRASRLLVPSVKVEPKVAVTLISDDFTIRPGIWIGSAVSVGGLSWVSDREPPGYWDEAVRTSSVGLFNSNSDQNSSGYIPSTLITNNDCQIDVTFNLSAAANAYDSIWVWFNVYPQYVPGSGIQSAYDGSGFSPMCGIRLYPRDTNNNQSEMFFYGQLQDAAGGNSKNTALMSAGLNTIRIYVNGVDVFFYLNGTLLTSTQDTVFFRNWSTVRRFHQYPGVGLQWDNNQALSGHLMPTAFVVSGTLAVAPPSAFWTERIQTTEVDT